MKRMNKITYVKFGIDILMAITFVLFFNKQVLGGLTFHEIAGIAIAVVFFTHLMVNWRWIKNVTLKLFDRKLSFKTKFGYLLNLLLLISMAFIITSGIFISRVVFPNINIGEEQWFKISHMSISYLVLILVAVHIGLHWKWVINVFNNIIKVKTHKPILGIIAKVATIALLVFGGYQMYSSNFIIQVQRITKVFNVSSSQTADGDFKGRERPNFSEGNFKGDEDHAERPASPEGGFRGGEGHTGISNAIDVMITYFSIMSVFIIIVYYLGKLRTKRNRKTVSLKRRRV
ncbi:DUF4405 domain-containing protein [Neobacillus drentensis]|uniref:DUF4405 domain-containing protein n=1 Tax=Neobacillus drentensis TaxID=220684 RepID=UPI002FFD5EA8